MVNLKEIEKQLLEKRKQQLRNGLLKVAKALKVTSLSFSVVNKIKTKAQWEAALNKIDKEMTTKAKRVIKKGSVVITPSKLKEAKTLISKLRPMWNKLK